MKGGQGEARDADFGLAAAAVDDGSGREHLAAGLGEQIDHFASAAAGGDDILYDDGGLAGFDGETAAERHPAAGAVALGEQEWHPEGTGYFVADDQSAHGGGNHQIDGRAGETAQRRGEFATEALGMVGEAENPGALQVFAAVEAAGETEVAAEVGARLFEESEDAVGWVAHIDILSQRLFASGSGRPESGHSRRPSGGGKAPFVSNLEASIRWQEACGSM